MSKFVYWPAWFYGPNGASAIFNAQEEVPEGWHDHPSKIGDRNAVTEVVDEEEVTQKRQAEVVAESLTSFVYWPAWFYGPAGASAIFNAQEEVPEGWHDHPSKIGDRNAVTEVPDNGVISSDGDDDDDSTVIGFELPEIDEIEKSDILEQLTARSVAHNQAWKKDRLYDLLKDALDAEEKAD